MPIPLLQAALRDDLQAVDGVLRQALYSDVALIGRIADHIIAGGGKRLRPALLLLVAQACGYRGPNQHTLAAVIEEVQSWMVTGRSCFKELLEKLGLALPAKSILDQVLPTPSG